MLNNATKTHKFFVRETDPNYPYWRLKTPDEYENETGIKSKEARKYIFNCLDDMAQVNVPGELEGGDLLAEKADRKEFIDLLKRMLSLDQEKRISPGEALNHNFITLNHLLDYAHCRHVKETVQTMEVCKRRRFNSSSSNEQSSRSDVLYGGDHHSSSAASALVSNISSTANATLAFNNLQNQLPSYAAQMASIPANNFYGQIAAPRGAHHSNRNNITAQFAARALQAAAVAADQFQTAALCVPSIFNSQHHANPSAVNLGYQNLSSPKQIVPIQHPAQPFQPSLLAAQQQLFVPQWPPLSNATQRALALQQHNQLILHAQDPLNPLSDLTESDQQESAAIYDQLARNSNYINSQNAMWNMVSAHQPAHQSMINSRPSQSSIRGQPLPAHLSSSATMAACLAAAVSNSANCSSSRCAKQKQQLGASQLSPAKKRIKESSPPKWSSRNESNTAASLQFGNSNKLIYSGRNAPLAAGAYLDNNYSSLLLNSPCLADEENWRGVLRNEMMCNENLLAGNQFAAHASGHIKEKMRRNHQTITLSDTPSPNNSVVSVITISDSDEDNLTGNQAAGKSEQFGKNELFANSASNFTKEHLKALHKNSHSNNNQITSSTCDSVLPLTPNEEAYQTPSSSSLKLPSSASFINKPLDCLRKNAISNSAQQLRQSSSDSDSDLISSSFSPLKTLPNFTTNLVNNSGKVIKPEPMSNSSHAIQQAPGERLIAESKKKRILSKSQSLSYEGGLNQVASGGGGGGGSTTSLNPNAKNIYSISQLAQANQIQQSAKKQQELDEKIVSDVHAHLLSNYPSSGGQHLHTSSSSNQLSSQLQNQLLTSSASLDNLAGGFPASRFIKLEKTEHHERFANKCSTNLTGANCLKTSRNHGQLASNLYNADHHPLSVSQQQQLTSLHYLVNHPNNLIQAAADPSFYHHSSQSSNYPASQSYTLSGANPNSYSSKYHIPPPAHQHNPNHTATSMNINQCAAACAAFNYFSRHPESSNVPLPAHIQNAANNASNLPFHNLYGFNSKNQPYPSLLYY